MALGYLLARRGIGVTVLETHRDFARVFRGEGLQMSGIDAIRQMGLGEELDLIPYTEARTIAMYANGREIVRTSAASMGRANVRPVAPERKTACRPSIVPCIRGAGGSNGLVGDWVVSELGDSHSVTIAGMHAAPRVRGPWFNFGRRMSVARGLVVAVGILLPYAVRILGIPAQGVRWFTSYLGGGIEALLFLGTYNAICWGSILLATLTYRHVRSVWFPALAGFAVLAFYHARLDLAASSMAAIGLLFIPTFTLPYVFVGWLIGLLFDRLVLANTATELGENTGRFSLRSLLVVVLLVSIACGLWAYGRQRQAASSRESIRQAILNGETIDPKISQQILGSEYDTLKPTLLTEDEILVAAIAEVTKRTSLQAYQIDETVNFSGDQWRVVAWRLPKTRSEYYVVTLSKSGRVNSFIKGK
jgi:FAD binding domain